MDQNAVQLNYDLVPSPQVASKLQRQMQELERNLRFKGPFGPAAREVKDFGSELDRANQRVITLGASFAVLATGIKTLKDIVRSTIEVEKAFIEINTVFGLSAKGLDAFSKQLFSTARDTAQSFDKAASAAKEFSRQGLTAEETIKRTRDALMLTRLANLDVAKSVETLTASINGFQKSALTSTEIVNKLATVDAKFAVSSADLAEALARSGAAASDAGVSFDQLIGIVTAAQQTTARGGAVIGNALKTIFTRVERQDTIEAFRSLGVEVEDSKGAILGAIPLLQNFAKTYDGLNGALKKQAAEMVGGVYQINILKAVLGDLAKAQGIATQATNISANATDEAIKRNEALNQSLDAMLTKLGVTAKQIGSNIGGQSFAGPLKTILSAVQDNPVTAWLEDASGKAETIGGKIAQELMQGIGGTLVYGLGPLLAAALGKVVLSTSKNVLRDFGDLTQLTTQGQAQARVQTEIVSLYRAGGAALQQQLAAMSSLTDKAALLQRLLTQTANNPNNPANMASVMVGQGYRGRGLPRAASGYVPMAEEAAMIARGVGGAPAGAKPVFLPNFNRGGGQRGIVANTSEFIVPGAAGGAIFNREMIQKYGLPPGSTPVAAGGFIPNAAGSYAPGDLRMQAGTVGNLGGGFLLQPGQLNALNDLFANLSKAGTLAEAYKVGPQIVDMANSLDKLSQKRVLKDLATEMDRIAMKSRIITDQSRRMSPDQLAAFEAERATGAGFGDDYNDYLNRRDGVARPRRPGAPAPAPTFWQRMRGRVNAQNAGLAAAFALPFAGGMIDEGKGGTASGIGRGALGSGLTAAGTGASFGLMFGPAGAGIGAGVGLVLGGAYGALRKMEQSFEELAAEINEANAKIQRQVEFVQSAYRLQGDVISAIQNGAAPGKIESLRKARTQSILSVEDPKIRSQLISRLNDPNGLSDITDLLTEGQRRSMLSENIQSATRRALDTSRVTRGLFGYASGAHDDMAKALLPALQQLSGADRERMARMAGTDPGRAFAMVAESTGMKRSAISSLIERTHGISPAANNTQELFHRAIQQAFKDLNDSGIIEVEEGSKKAEAAAAKFGKTLQQLSAEYRLQGSLAESSLGALRMVTSVRDQMDLQHPGLLDTERLQLRGRQEVQQLAIQSGSQRRATLLNGRASLIDLLTSHGAQGADSEAFRSRIAGLGSLEAVMGLRNELGTTGGARGLPGVATQEFKDKLDELINELQVSHAAQEEQTKAIRQATDIQVMQIRRSRTLFGGSIDYQGAARNAGYGLTGAIGRNDVPDVLRSNIVGSSLADLDRRFQAGQIDATRYRAERLGLLANSEGANRVSNGRAMRRLIGSNFRGSDEISGDQVTSALLGEAQQKGLQGDAKGSFLGGFRSVMEGAKRDLMDFSRIGAQLAENLNHSFTDFWTSWSTGAQKGKDAFKGFVASVLTDASRMLASKAFTAAISAIPGFSGFGAASGGRMGFASGGMVPAMLTGGEFVFGPKAAKQVGYDTLRRLNGYADGGMVRGGSGVKDDVPANLPSGSFVIRKSAVQKLGPDYLKALAAGKVQHRWIGGALIGGLLGGGIGYAVGGKKGAIGGALLGAIGGGLYQHSFSGLGGIGSVGPDGAAAGGAATLSIGTKAALGLGAAMGLGMLAGGITRDKDKGPISLADVKDFKDRHEAYYANQMAKDRKAGQQVFLQVNPQGGYSLAGFDMAPATRRWSDGGGVDVPLTPMPSFSGGGGSGTVQQQVSVRIEINNNGGVSSSSESEGGVSPEAAGRLEKLVRGWVRDEQVQSFRSDGFMTQRSRYVNNYA